MTSTSCPHCQAVLPARAETCPECGELTPLGIEKERRQRRRAEQGSVWRPTLGNPNFTVILFVVGFILMILVVLAVAYLVNNGLI